MLPPTMKSANIILLLKPGKDAALSPSYGPVYLKNANLKIIRKVLAKTIEKITAHIIHPSMILYSICYISAWLSE